MLFRQSFLDGIARGDVTLAFRRWEKPTVKTGGTLTTAVGVLGIDDVGTIAASTITAEDAQRAGFASKADLLRELEKRSERPIFRVRFHLAGEDPRVALRSNAALSDDDVASLAQRLAGFDEGAGGPWTRTVLTLIGEHPGTRAPALAARLGQETLVFKTNVRKLKGLGLTESLPIGYRLSPRGQTLLERLGVKLAPPTTPEALAPPPPASALETFDDVIAFMEQHGVVLQAAKGPVPTLTHAIAGEEFSKSWWGHPRAHTMFNLLSALQDCGDVMACKLFEQKKTWVHRRLWPHVACLSPRLPEGVTDVVVEEHTARGAHRVVLTPLLDWLPDDALAAASLLSEEEALEGLGWWVAAELDR